MKSPAEHQDSSDANHARPDQKSWPKEDIPDTAVLYYRVHCNDLKGISGDDIPLGVFRNVNVGMSTDWDKHSTAQEALMRAKDPTKNGILRLTDVGDVRTIEGQLVDHAPSIKNRSHTNVCGNKTPEVRIKLKRLAEWAIRYQAPGGGMRC